MGLKTNDPQVKKDEEVRNKLNLINKMSTKAQFKALPDMTDNIVNDFSKQRIIELRKKIMQEEEHIDKQRQDLQIKKQYYLKLLGAKYGSKGEEASKPHYKMTLKTLTQMTLQAAQTHG